MTVSESQRRANKKWRQKNPQRSNYLSKRSTTRNFIAQYGTLKDVEALQSLVDERLVKRVESDSVMAQLENDDTEDDATV